MITLLWENATGNERTKLEATSQRHEVDVVRVPKGALPRMVLGCLAKGGVIVLVRDDAEASRALGLGVDEVIRTNRLTDEALDLAVQRARTRAEARVVREAFMRKTSGEDDAIALRLLARAVSHEVNNPLQALVLDVESLAAGVQDMLDLNSKLVSAQLLSAPELERRKLKDAISKLPDPSDFEDIFENMRECLRRAARAMHRFGALTYELSDSIQVGKIATELVEILKDEGVVLGVEVKGRCEVSVGRPVLVCVIGALLAHAMESLHETKRENARIHVRVTDEEGAVLVEIEHSGMSVPADLRPGVFQPYFGKKVPATGLQGIRERARRWGGDFLVLSEADTTTFRLIIPKMERLAGEPEVLESVPRIRLYDYDD